MEMYMLAAQLAKRFIQNSRKRKDETLETNSFMHSIVHVELYAKNKSVSSDIINSQVKVQYILKGEKRREKGQKPEK